MRISDEVIDDNVCWGVRSVVVISEDVSIGDEVMDNEVPGTTKSKDVRIGDGVIDTEGCRDFRSVVANSAAVESLVEAMLFSVEEGEDEAGIEGPDIGVIVAIETRLFDDGVASGGCGSL